MDKVLLRGRLTRGMFPNERYAVIKDHKGRGRTLVVPDYVVHNLGESEGEEGFIEVQLIEDGGKLALVRLPGEVFGSARTVTVDESELQPVPA